MNPANLTMVERCVYEEPWAIAPQMIKVARRFPSIVKRYPQLFTWNKKLPIPTFCSVSMAVSCYFFYNLLSDRIYCANFSNQTRSIISSFSPGTYRRKKYHRSTCYIYKSLKTQMLQVEHELDPLLRGIAEM